MRKRHFFFFCFLMLFFYACSDNKNSKVNEDFIYANIVSIDTANKKIWPKFLYGDILCAWSIDYYGGKLTKKNEWQKADSLFVAGHGHNEFGLVTLAQDDNKSLYVLNRPMMGDKLISLIRIPQAKSISAIKNEDNWEKYDLKRLPPFYNGGENFVILSDSSILVAGAPYKDIEHIFSVIDYKKQKVTPLNYWPEDGAKCSSLPKHRIYTEHSILLGNGQGRFLYKHSFNKLAFLFSIDGSSVNVIKYIYSEALDYSEGSSKFDFEINKKPIERLACCGDAKRIYMLCRDSDIKGNKLKVYKPFVFGNTVEVYNWEGIKQQVLHLDKLGQNIMLSDDGQTLYLFSGYSDDTPEPIIYSYDLSSLKS